LGTFDIPAAEPRVGAAEQSNTSVIYGDALILKWFRRVQVGIQPEVEMTEALMAADFAHVPRLYGIAAWQGEGAATIAVLQEYLAGAEEGWELALSSARTRLRAGDALDSGDGEMAAAARDLGEVTGSMHVALSGLELPGFRSHPATIADCRAWVREMEAELDEVLARPRVPDLLRERAADVRRAWARAGDVASAGRLTRVHGDYHLGQVLRHQGHFFILDFEGEPSRPLEERRALRSPLVDVAGMLRSFDYAAQTARRDIAPEDARTAARADAWCRLQQEAFVRGYRAAAGALVPEGADFDALLRAFELRKAVYEVGYEMAHRPDWLPIPLAAVAGLVQ
jgi:maltokinase